ncbi:hypothetical protein SynROS8604_02426 [Synechococcus sp. ROS8604]|nr:hypothetical protein SynROS8604_02426 [Synechococcus sp. ROS8604]
MTVTLNSFALVLAVEAFLGFKAWLFRNIRAANLFRLGRFAYSMSFLLTFKPQSRLRWIL